MRHIAVGVIVLLAAATAGAQSPEAKASLEEHAIAAAKHVSARSLDGALPDIPFEKWFQSMVGAGAKPWWEANDCGEQTGDEEEGAVATTADVPLCAQVSALRPQHDSVTVMIAVGSYQKGVNGDPAVFYAAVNTGEGVSKPVKALHELPAAIEEIEAGRH